ncbi:MAG: potassium-transporting ATPase subunit KdpC [Cyanobacteria bacterium SZAS-4]|nr:potassium-transporting ATPase subunit KdpC [Cyanobacteria bacterium SZAS-4]
MLKELIPAIRITLVLALLTGLAFPLLITVISQVIFPDQANGSLLRKDGKVIGSRLIAQRFESPKYFHPRPSAAGSGYAGEASGGTNLGPTSSKLIMGIADDPATKADESFAGIKQLAEAYRKDNQLAVDAPIPVDAVTRSGSGLDPDISEDNAMLQAPRIAKARGMSAQTVTEIIRKYKTERDLGILGEPRLNVLTINMALDNGK